MDAIVTYHSQLSRHSINVEAVLDAISEQVLIDGDVEKALQRAFRFGTDEEMGLLDILDRLRVEPEELESPLQKADQHASEMAQVSSERRHDDALEMREALRQVESLDDLKSVDPELMQRTLTTDEMAWMEKWSDIKGQMIESGLVVSAGNRLKLTSKAIRRIGSRLLQHMILPPQVRGRGAHLIHRSGTATASSDDVIPWEWGRPFDVHITKSLFNALRHQRSHGSITLSTDDFDLFDRESGAAVATVLLIDMSRSMFESGAWDAAKRAAIALNTLHANSRMYDTLHLIGFSGDARKLSLEDLPSLHWDQFSHGTNLHAGLIAAGKELQRHHGKNRQIVVITDGEPTAFMEGATPTFEHPVTERTIQSTLREARRLARRGLAITVIRVEDIGPANDFAESFVRATGGRLINVPLDSLGSFVVRDIARGTTQYVR